MEVPCIFRGLPWARQAMPEVPEQRRFIVACANFKRPRGNAHQHRREWSQVRPGCWSVFSFKHRQNTMSWSSSRDSANSWKDGNSFFARIMFRISSKVLEATDFLQISTISFNYSVATSKLGDLVSLVRYSLTLTPFSLHSLRISKDFTRPSWSIFKSQF